MNTEKTTQIINDNSQDKFQSWAFLELMGHRKLAGFVQETEIAAGKFLRIDVPVTDGKTVTQFYAPASVYCITPTTEGMVRAYAAHNSPSPVHRFELTFVNDIPKVDKEVDDFEGDFRV